MVRSFEENERTSAFRIVNPSFGVHPLSGPIGRIDRLIDATRRLGEDAACHLRFVVVIEADGAGFVVS